MNQLINWMNKFRYTFLVAVATAVPWLVAFPVASMTSGHLQQARYGVVSAWATAIVLWALGLTLIHTLSSMYAHNQHRHHQKTKRVSVWAFVIAGLCFAFYLAVVMVLIWLLEPDENVAWVHTFIFLLEIPAAIIQGLTTYQYTLREGLNVAQPSTSKTRGSTSKTRGSTRGSLPSTNGTTSKTRGSTRRSPSIVNIMLDPSDPRDYHLNTDGEVVSCSCGAGPWTRLPSARQHATQHCPLRKQTSQVGVA